MSWMDEEEFNQKYAEWRAEHIERIRSDRAEELRVAVGKAISDYVEFVTGDGFVLAWVAGADVTTPLMERSNKSFVQVVAPGDTSAAHIRGIADTLKESF